MGKMVGWLCIGGAPVMEVHSTGLAQGLGEDEVVLKLGQLKVHSGHWTVRNGSA